MTKMAGVGYTEFGTVVFLGNYLNMNCFKLCSEDIVSLNHYRQKHRSGLTCRRTEAE